MRGRILFIDDDKNLLASHVCLLHNQFIIDTAPDGQQGLETIRNKGPYAVVVSDLHMPGMDGIQLLSQVREVAPESVRMLFTGYAGLQTFIEAVNKGNIFRLLTKPCPSAVLREALAAGVKQYRLVMAERELLKKTLSSTIKILTEVLSIINPEAFGRSCRITRYVREMANKMELKERWKYETAAMLSQIGFVILPGEALKKIYRGLRLTPEEDKLFQTHPSVGSDLIRKIPRMEKIAEVVAFQEKCFDGSGPPKVPRQGEDIPLGARLLKVALDFEFLEAAGSSQRSILTDLKKRSGLYDPNVLTALESVIGIEAKNEVRGVTIMELEENMILEEDIRTIKGLTLITKGQKITLPIIERLKRFTHVPGVREPIKVIVPVK